MQKNYIFFLFFLTCFSLQAFDHKAFLVPWQELIADAYQEKITYHQEQIASRKRVLAIIAQQQRPYQPNKANALRILHENELLLGYLQSEHLALDHIRITYYNVDNNGNRPFNCIYLQLENSYYWHFLHALPTFYSRDEKKLDKELKKLEKIIASGKMPKVSFKLSNKSSFHIPFTKPSKILYTLHLDFGDIGVENDCVDLLQENTADVAINK